MGNRVGVILHNNWEEFSPLLYSHYGADTIFPNLKTYLKKYELDNSKNSHSGHIYNCKHMMVGFIQTLDPDIHIRIESLDFSNINKLKNHKTYPNYFEGGCYIVNVSEDKYGLYRKIE